jgi:phosphate butyryltransferase
MEAGRMKQMKTMQDIRDAVKGAKPKKVAVAVAADSDVLSAVNAAKQAGIANFILVGDKERILEISKENKFDVSGMEIIEEKDPAGAAAKAVGLVASGKADIVMKGLLESSVFLKAVFAKEGGLKVEGNIINSMAIMEMKELDRLVIITDPGFIPLPDLETKKKMIQNAVSVMVKMGIAEPKVAVLCASETVSPKMISTVDAHELEEMNKRGEIKGCQVAGPISLDLAISEKAAKHKGYTHPVAGKADLLVVPSIEVGNVFYKSLIFFAHLPSGGVVAGAKAPIIFTSRSDSAETKLNTIALAVFLAQKE